jgi:hypothetical protein
MNLTLNNIYPKTGYKSYTNGAKKHTKNIKNSHKCYTNSIQIHTGNFLKKRLFFGAFLIVIFTLKEQKSAK